MKLRKRTVLTVCLLLAAMFLISGCSGEKNPYEVNDAENFNVSVKFDANGGLFTTNTSVIVDSFDISKLQTNNAGQVEIALLSPDDQQRGKDGFTAYNNGYFLAGWYAERISSTDEQGNTVYTYSNKWDFASDTVKVHASGTYNSSKPVMTLYAAWVPMFEIEFYDLDTGTYLDKMSFDPNTVDEITVPVWNEDTGAIDMFDFPEKDGYTFTGVYYDDQGTQAVDTATIAHSGSVNYDNGTVTNGTMKLYVDWMEGKWFHIYTAEQFVDNIKMNLNGNFVIHADLDFSDEIWPTNLADGSFGGTIQGNGYTFKNISLTQTNMSKTSFGLFGQMKDTAKVTDLTFDNVTFTIEKGARVSGATFGVLAGQVDSNATLNNLQILNSTLQINTACAFLSDDYSIGLVCGGGEIAGIDMSGISCVVVGENPETLTVTVEGNTVILNFLSE